MLDGKALTPDEIKKLADLESREVLLAKLAGAMKASLTQAVSLFAAPLSQTARVIGGAAGRRPSRTPASCRRCRCCHRSPPRPDRRSTEEPEAADEAPAEEAPPPRSLSTGPVTDPPALRRTAPARTPDQ